MRNNLKVLLAGLFLATLTTGPLIAAEVHPATGEILADDQTFRYSIIDEPSSLDPQLVEDESGAEIIRDLFEGLMNQDSDGNLISGVATHFTVNDDNSVYTFFLRRDARWSDGNPVTANDFVYAWRRVADPATASPYSWFIEVMSLKGASEVLAGDAPVETLGVKAINDTTLEVTLSHSVPYFPLMTTHVATFPTPSWAIDAFGSNWTSPENIVSNGAYTLTEYVTNEGSVRTRNSMYWNDVATIIDKTIVYVVNDENVAFDYFTDGQLDRVAVPTGQYPETKSAYPDETFSFPRLCSYYYSFNLSENGPPAFKDARVRKALSYAIDRELVISGTLRGGQIAAFTFTPGATARFVPPSVEYGELEQEKRDAIARQLLAEAGYGSENPLSFTLLYNTSVGHKKIASAIAAMWLQKLGVNVELVNLDWRDFLEARGRQKFDLARAGWCGDYNEASTFLDLVTSDSLYNDGRFSSAEIDRLMVASRTMDQPFSNYTAVEQILADEMPIIPLYHYTGLMMLNSAIKNWPINNAEQNWYSRDLYKIKK
jgi:oligopeptide transport system substrate-binding protein